MNFYIVDAFTSVPFGGNTAGVVILPDNSIFPEDILIQKIAAELRYSETAFVIKNTDGDFTTRYFTPEGEVDLCGHATIALFTVLIETGAVKKSDMCINRTKAGNLKVKIDDEIWMDMAAPKYIGKIETPEELYRIMSGKEMESLKGYVPEIISTGLPDIILPVSDLHELNSLRPDMQALADLSRELGVTGVHAFAMEKDNYTAHVRNFAPLYGIDEESATGTANGALTYYLYKYGIVTPENKCIFIQGEAMGRASEISAAISEEGSVRVGGSGIIVASGTLHL